MTREEIIEQLNLVIGLIKQDDKDWLDDRDIPMLEECVKALSQEPQCTEQPCLGTLCRYYKEPCRVKNELNVELNELRQESEE